MNSQSFRHFHLIELLLAYNEQTLPLDLFMSNYFRHHKAIGAKDRGFIADTVYSMMRLKGLLDYLCQSRPSWEERYQIFASNQWKEALSDSSIPLETRLSFPKSLFDLIIDTHGMEQGCQLCQISNTAAPTTIRANTLKISRDALLAALKEEYQVKPTLFSDMGITFEKKINFFGLPEFKKGLFEVQDEGSQLLAQLIQAKPGELVLDYCSGSGGKTLAFAPLMEQKGQIFLHDVRKHILFEARKRLRRAGVQNAQIIMAEDPKLRKIKKKMDWVLVDVPCTGTGTMRRNPDMKWKFTQETLQRLLGQQRVIFEKALSYLKPEGKIVYATCSLLKAENEEQVAHFIKTYELKVENRFQSLPIEGGMDGFFGVAFKK